MTQPCPHANSGALRPPRRSHARRPIPCSESIGHRRNNWGASPNISKRHRSPIACSRTNRPMKVSAGKAGKMQRIGDFLQGRHLRRAVSNKSVAQQLSYATFLGLGYVPRPRAFAKGISPRISAVGIALYRTQASGLFGIVQTSFRPRRAGVSSHISRLDVDFYATYRLRRASIKRVSVKV
jgi:hypothetical protein